MREAIGGRELFFTRRDLPGLWRMPASGGVPERVVPDLLPADGLNWEPAGDGVYFIERRPSQVPRISRWTSSGGGIEVVAKLEGNLPYPSGLSVAPDESTVLWVRLDSSESDLLLARDFR